MTTIAKPFLIDSHEHLQFDIFNEDREEVIRE